MPDSIFTKIINREIPAEILWENENIIVLMDAFPHVDGQVLVIPKVQVDKFYDLDDQYYTELFQISKFVAKNLETVFGKTRVALIVEGFEVPHVHVKLYPVNEASETMNEITDELKGRIKLNAEKIRNVLN
jgi:histidine triad (HIT) family protein